MTVLVGLLLIIVVIRSAQRAVPPLHFLQLEGYRNLRFLKRAKGHLKRLVNMLDVSTAAILLVVGVLATLLPVRTQAVVAAAVVWVATQLCLAFTERHPPPKKPLVYTGRAIRILTVATLLSVLFVMAIVTVAAPKLLEGGTEIAARAFAAFLAASFALTLTAPLLIVAGNLVLVPLQSTINQGYVWLARRRLSQVRPLVIGITGSYGKTTTKHVLETILSGRFNTLKTPESYNTRLGLSRAINELLRMGHEVFIAELGAYQRGDIRQLCNLVRPSIGILTAVGPQHLERFQRIETIADTKYELIEGLPEDGCAVINNDDEICRQLARRTSRRVRHFGIRNPEDPGIVAEQVQTTAAGSAFTVTAWTGETARFTTKLLGLQNIYNILAAAAVALELGITLSEVAYRVSLVDHVPHRLQVILQPSGVTIVDDGYNSNPVGAAAALDVLGQFNKGRRILVTPGMVELGPIESKENRQLGQKAAEVCDIVVLVGNYPACHVAEGLRDKSFPEEHLKSVPDLRSATEVLRSVVRPGDTVLIENDLPDTYGETG